MFSMFKSLFQRSTSGSKRSARREPSGQTSSRGKNRAYLQIEALEERLVPTVVFDPHFAKESPQGPTSTPYAVLNNPTVYLILWGKGWSGSADVGNLTTDAQAVISSKYFSALQEWGKVGTVQWGGEWTDSTTNPPAGFNPGVSSAITTDQGEVARAIKNKPSWAPSGQTPVYVVVTPPSVGGSGSGYNGQGSYNGSSINICSVSTSAYKNSPAVVQNFFGQTFSHELAERISDPASGGVTISYSTDPSFPGFYNQSLLNVNNNPSLSGNQGYLNNSGQIGDGEQEPGGEAHYGYVVNGIVNGIKNGIGVQSLWSAATLDSSNQPGAFIVADGNSESIFLEPIWTTGTIPTTSPKTSPAITGPVFTGNYNLVIKGDQLASADDQININASDSSVIVVENKQTFTFNGFFGKIQTITVEAGAGQNSITVTSLAADQTLNVVAAGSDTVNLGGLSTSSPSSLGSVQGTVSITGNGQTSLNLFDESGAAGASYEVAPIAIFRNNAILVFDSNTAAITLNPGSAARVKIDPMEQQLWGSPAVTVAGFGDTSLTVQDQASSLDPTTYTVNSNGITIQDDYGGAWGVNYSALASLTVNTASSANVVNVESTAGVTTVDDPAANANIFVCPTSEDINAIGTLTIRGSGSAALTVNDQADPGISVFGLNSLAPSYTLTTNALSANALLLTGSAGATVNFAGLASLNVKLADTGSQLDVEGTPTTTTIQAGTGATTINLAPTSQNLDNILGTLDLQGAGDTTLNVYDQNNADLLGTQYTLTGTALTRSGLTIDPYTGLPVTHLTSITYGGLANLALNTGALFNMVHVESTAAATTVNAGAGNVLVDVSAQAENLDNLPGALTVNGNGSDSLVVYDQNNPNNLMTQDTLTSTALTRSGLTTDPFVGVVQHVASITYGGVGNLVLNTGAMLNSVQVASTGAATTVAVGTGTLPVVIGSNGSVKGIQQLVTVNGTGAQSSVMVDDSQALAQYKVTISNGAAGEVQVGRAALDQLFANGGGLDCTGLSQLTLNLSQAAGDTVHVTPSAVTAYFLNGSAAEYPGPGAAGLALDLAGASTPQLTPSTPGAGTWAFGNRQPVSFSNMGMTPTVQVSDAGGTYNGQSFPATATFAGFDGMPSDSLEGVGLTLDYLQLNAAGNVAEADLGASAPTAAGNYAVIASFPGSADYTSASAQTTFSISQATPQVMVNAVNLTYGTALDNSQLSGTASAMVNGQAVNVAGTFVYFADVGTILPVGQNQWELVEFLPTDATDFNSVEGYVLVNVASATPSQPTVSVNPVNIEYGTTLNNAQLSGTATFNGQPVAGTFIYTSAGGTMPGVGTQPFDVTFTPDDTTDYATVPGSVQVTVSPGWPNLALNPVNIPYGTPLDNSQLSSLCTATAPVNGQTVNVAGQFVYVGGVGTILPVGQNQPELIEFVPTDSIDFNAVEAYELVNVTGTPTSLPTAYVNPVTIAYGTALNNAQLTGVAYFNGQSVAGSFSYTSAGGALLSAGTQAVAVTFTPTDNVDYANAAATVEVTVNPDMPQVSVNPVNITFGTALASSQLSGTASAMVGGAWLNVAGNFTYFDCGPCLMGAK